MHSKVSQELSVMEDLFSMLATGASFGKKRNADPMRVFRRTGEVNQIQQVDADHVTHFDDDDEVNAFRNRLKIKVKGDKAAVPVTGFSDMPLHVGIRKAVLTGIEESRWKEPTPIQMQAIPVLLDGRDLLAGAPTGSGKTAAYLLPILSLVSKLRKEAKKAEAASASSCGVLGLILAPTRELAEQIHREVVRLVGTKKIKTVVLTKQVVASALDKQDRSIFSGIDVIISTPMRLLALLRAKAINLITLRIAILDEADKLLEVTNGQELEEAETTVSSKRSSFLSQVDEILSETDPKELQRALFSATLGPLVQDLASSFLRDHVQVTVGVENAGATTIDQKLLFVTSEEGKLLAMRQLIQDGLKPPVLIFMQSKERSKALYKELLFDGINVDVIHAERSEQQREQAIASFRKGETWVLICTDLMARGVDFKGVQMVINYDLPLSPVSYIHRIGRTGRAGRNGTAVTFFTESDIHNLRSIANVMRLSGCDVPDWMLAIKALTTRQKKTLRLSAPKRKQINTESSYDRIKKAKRKQIIENSKAKSL